MKALDPAHLKDLKASGLDDATIEACGYESVRPHDIKLPGVVSAYRLPYWSLDGTRTDMERRKLFPPLKRSDGTQKYWQPPGSAPALYLPPGHPWGEIARDHQCVIRKTEGEKKAAALSQHGIPTIGIAGVWNWRHRLDNGERLVIPSVDQFVWKDRLVELIPDSDVWRKEKFEALCGFYALAQELVSRGADVRFMVLPEAGQGKVGVDDWLVEAGMQWQHYWPSLDRVTLDDARLTKAAKWWQGWREKQVLRQSLQVASQESMEINDLAGSFQVTFPTHQVSLNFQRLSENARGVSAEITVIAGHIELLGETDIGLKSDSSRDKLAKSLSRTADAIPWKRLLERACAEVLKRHRRGEPIVVLEPAESIHTPFILNPIVYRGHQTLIFAPGGSYKSYLSLYIALLAFAGLRQNGIGAVPTNVLYLDWELDAKTVGARLKALHTGHPELAGVYPYYRRCTQPLHLEAPQIAAEVARLGIGLIIVDSAALACGGDLNSPESAIKLQQALRRIGCASIVLAHVSKSTAEGQDRSTYGTVFFRELARNVWELSRPENSNRVLLSQTGSACKNSFGRKQEPLGFEFSFESDRVRITAFDPSEEEESGFEEKLPARQRIVRLLSDQVRRDPQEIAGALHLPASTIQSVLSRGRKEGTFDRSGPHQGGKWGLQKSLQPIFATKSIASSLQSLQRSTGMSEPNDFTAKNNFAPINEGLCNPSLLHQGGIYIPPTAKINDSKLKVPSHSEPEEVIDL